MLDAIPKRRLADMIADTIMEGVREGRFASGEQLPAEPELARQLAVGRTSVREALQKLQVLGVVEVVRGRGTFVRAGTDPSRAMFSNWIADHGIEIIDLVEVRLSIESTAAALAASRATAAELRALERLNGAHQEAADAADLDEVVATDSRFHAAVIEASRNPLLLRLYEALATELTEFRRRTLALPGAPKRSVDGHQAMIDAIKAGAPGDARRAATVHVWVLYEEIDAARPRGRQRRKRTIAPWTAFES